MGISDTLTCEVEVPELGVPTGITFQTKSIYASMVEFTITKTGRLIEHQVRHEVLEVQGSDRPVFKSVPIRNIDLEYHGDICFCGSAENGLLMEFVARFTDGQLTWIKKIEDISETHRSLLKNAF